MKLITFIINKKYVFECVCIVFVFTILTKNNFVFADSLSYSPDQWPRHWSAMVNGTNRQSGLGFYDACDANCYQKNNYHSERPARSPMWGMAPVAKDRPRRSMRPEYNSKGHVGRYAGMQHNYSPYYSGQMFPGMGGLANPYATSISAPYAVPVMAPGLAAPGLPFSLNPYGINAYPGSPYSNYSYAPFVPGFGPVPGVNYLW